MKLLIFPCHAVQAQQSIVKIPFLADIPIARFGSVNNMITETELAAVVTVDRDFSKAVSFWKTNCLIY